MRYFFIEPAALNKTVVAIEGPEVRHIKNVLRLKPGDPIRLFDGQGFEYEADIQRLLAGRVEVRIKNQFQATTESPLQITVAQALLKEKKMDRLLRHLCELGITHWVPFLSERSVPKPDPGRFAAREGRWKKILKESCKQCKRARLPAIIKTMTLEEMMDYGQDCDLKIIFWENAKMTLDSLVSPWRKRALRKILLILGPEGGFSKAEIKKAETDGCLVAGLGPRILRAETATIAACALIQYLFGDMG